MPTYFVTWLEEVCTGAHIEADTPEDAVRVCRGEECPEGRTQGVEVVGDICVSLNGALIYSEAARA